MWTSKSLSFSTWTVTLAVALPAVLSSSHNPSVAQRTRAQTSAEVVLAVVEPDGAVPQVEVDDISGNVGPEPLDLLEEEAEMQEEQANHQVSQGSTSGVGGGRALLKACAVNGGNCTCDGVVGYGKGDSRTFLRVSGTVACTGEVFGKKVGSPQHNCFCYALDWCLDKSKTGTDKTIDPAHRRRNFLGRQGHQFYQRRRWCGFGPRDCIWGNWGSWSACSGTCSESLRKRVRPQLQAAANGGKCDDDSEGTSQCLGVPSCPALAAAVKKEQRPPEKGKKKSKNKKKNGLVNGLKRLAGKGDGKSTKKKGGLVKGVKRLAGKGKKKSTKKKDGPVKRSAEKGKKTSTKKKGGKVKRSAEKGKKTSSKKKGGKVKRSAEKGKKTSTKKKGGKVKRPSTKTLTRKAMGRLHRRRSRHSRRSGKGSRRRGGTSRRKKQAHVLLLPEKVPDSTEARQSVGGRVNQSLTLTGTEGNHTAYGDISTVPVGNASKVQNQSDMLHEG